MNKVVTIIVTYNRKKMLDESIKSLLNQSYNNFDIFIIDNASTDGTYEEIVKQYESDRVRYFNTQKNIGGAGGFNFGVKEALKSGYDYAWLMDDDSVPEENALESIMRKSIKLNGEFSYIASFVKWIDNSFCKMNYAVLENTKILYDYEKLNDRLLAIESATFVGCFINLETVKKVGLPIKEFFIYADDYEYTMRLANEKTAYLDLDSIIIHKMQDNVTSEVHTVLDNRIDRYYYDFRNVAYILRKTKGIKGYFKILFRFIRYFYRILKLAKTKKLRRIWVITKGSFAGIFFNPKIEYSK